MTEVNKDIYMDHNATTPLHPEVLEKMMPYLTSEYGNPNSSTYGFGIRARLAVEGAREEVAAFINADPKEIFFTSGATEADNLAIKGSAFDLREKSGGNHIITIPIEHKEVLETCKHLEKNGISVTRVPVAQNGIVDPAAIKDAITEKTILIAIMYANSEIGTIQPVREIADIAVEKGIRFFSDAVQAVGKIPVDVEKDGFDLMALSGHKFYGPKGVGALYMKRGVGLEPLIHGGGQERSIRSGTENVPGIVGLGAACTLAARDLKKEMIRLQTLRDSLYDQVRERIPMIHLNGDLEHRLPHNINICFKYIEGESLILSMRGIAVSSGSACTSDSLEPSYVLRAIGVPRTLAHSSIRFGLGRSNTAEHVDTVVDSLEVNVAKLREMSPLYSTSRS